MRTEARKVLAWLAAVVLGGLLLGQTAYADGITGSIAFFGSASASGSTTVSFNNPWVVLSGTDTYAAIPFLTPTTFSPVSYTGTGFGATLNAPVAPLWTLSVGGITYQFDLQALTNAVTSSNSITMAGVGVARATGYDDTTAFWSLQGTGTGFTFALSSASSTAVPDGGTTLALLGLACGIVEGIRRKTKA